MFCVSCGSVNQVEVRAVMLVHFPGLKCLDKPGVFLFPDLLVCLDCGTSQFHVSKQELALFANGGIKSESFPVQ
jgi:hypothetical protein